MAIERRTYIGKIPLPFSRTEVAKGEQALISSSLRRFNGKIIELAVTSKDSLNYIQDISQEKSPPVRNTIPRFLRGNDINKAHVRVKYARLSSYGYKWKKD